MASDLVFYTNPASRGRIVRWMLEEVGAPYETVIVDFGKQTASAEYRKLNPMAKVPTVIHRGKVITECAAICAYLADAFPAANLAPTDDERADYYRWMFFAAGPLEAAITDRSLGVEVPADKQVMVGYGTYDRAVDTLEKAVSAYPYITGDRFTAADVYVGSHIGFGLMVGSLPKRDAFAAYLGRVGARPASIRAREIDDALMPKKAG